MKTKAFPFYLLFIIAWLFPGNNVNANFQHLNFHHLDMADGLISNNINDLVQDKHGFLWIATNEGLVVYNGNTFDPINLSGLDTSIKEEIRCLDLFKDSNGDMWIGSSRNGLIHYNCENGNFTVFKHEKGNPGSLANNYVTNVIEEREGVLWVTYWGGIARFDIEKGIFMNKELPIALPNSCNISCLAIDDHENLWIGTNKAGLFKANLEGEVFKHYQHDPLDGRTISHQNISDIVLTSSGDLLISTWGGGLNKYIHTDDSFIKYKHVVHDESSVNDNKINDIHEGADRNLFFGTESGLSILPAGKTEFINYNYKHGLENELHSSVVYCIYEMTDGTIFLGTYFSGLSYFNPGYQRFRKLAMQGYNNLEGESNLVHAILVRENGHVYIGNEAGLLVYLPGEDKYKKIDLPDVQNPLNEVDQGVHYIFEGHDGMLWFGYYGLLKYDPVNQKVLAHHVHDPLDRSSLIDNNIKSIQEDEKGNLWMSTLSGICYFDQQKEQFNNYRDVDLYGQGNEVKVVDLELMDEETIVFALFSRFVLLNHQTNEKTVFLSSDWDKENGVFKGNITRLFYSRENGNEVWLATSSGLQIFDLEQGKVVEEYTTADGLSSNMIMGIQKDTGGDYWISTDNGLCKFMVKQGRFVNFHESDGLVSNIFNKGANTISPEGELFFGTNRGVVSFFPGEIKINTTPPDVYITDLLLHQGSEKESVKGNAVHLPRNKELFSIEPRQNIFTIRFTALNFINPEKARFMYKLEGFDDEWKNCSEGQLEATYMNIPHGKYTFRVKADNGYGFWNETGDTLALKINPPFYKTFWFRLMLFGLILLVLFLVYRARVKFYKLQQIEMQQKVRDQVVVIKSKEEELSQQSFSLSEANKLLKERQEKVYEQNQQILEQKRKLEEHQVALEKQVAQRTRELNEALQKAEESDRLKTSFLENMSHELRTPMNGIMGFAELINTPDVTDEERKDFLQIIRQSTDQLLTIITDIVEISKLESNQIVIKQSEFDLNKLLTNLEQNYQAEKIKRDKDHLYLKLSKGLPDTRSNIISDEARLTQILNYLVKNAIKFTEKGGVEFGYILRDDHFLEFHVRDTGIGIRPEKQRIIFDRFRQVDDENSRKYGGTGLGLTISKGLLKLMDGNIWLDSVPEEGTTFHFKIPFRPANKEEYYQKVKERSKLTDYNWKNRKILIVEDEEPNYRLLNEVLKPSKATIIHAKNGQQAIDFCRDDDKIDLVLMDIKLPDITGLDATKIIRGFNKNLPIIAQTAHAMHRDRDKCISAGCNEYLSKPIDSYALYSMLDRFMK